MSDLPLYKMFVGGEYVSSASGKTFKVENLTIGQVIAHVSEVDTEDTDNAVRVAAKAFASWGKTSGEERGDILCRAAEVLAGRWDELVRLEVEVRRSWSDPKFSS